MIRFLGVWATFLALCGTALGALPYDYRALPWKTRAVNRCIRGLYRLAMDPPGRFPRSKYSPGDRLAFAATAFGDHLRAERFAYLAPSEQTALRHLWTLEAGETPERRSIAILHGAERLHFSPVYAEAPLTPRTLVRRVHFTVYGILPNEGQVDGLTFVHVLPARPTPDEVRDIFHRARAVLSWRVAANGEHRRYLFAHGIRVIVATPEPKRKLLLITTRFPETEL